MFRKILPVLLVSFCFVSVASAVIVPPTIIVGPGGVSTPYKLLENTSGQWIDIYVSGGNPIEGCNFNAQIGDGGPAASGTAAPVITGIDLETGIFAGNNQGQVDQGSIPQVAMFSITTATGTVSASGILARLEIDTTGYFGDQTWTLALDATHNGTTDFAPAAATITDGAINIPEPATLSLLAIGGLAMIRRRKA